MTIHQLIGLDRPSGSSISPLPAGTSLSNAAEFFMRFREDDTEAVRRFRLATDQGHAAGQNSLGRMYAEGRGVPQDDTEAVRWFRLAADQGLPVAQNELGLMYAEGRGVPQNYADAVRWFASRRPRGTPPRRTT